MKISTLIILFSLLAAECFAQPTITSFTSSLTATGSAATGTTVTINGTNFTGATAVGFGGTAAASFTVVTAVKITAVVGSGSSGNVSVTTPSGTATKSGFYYTPLSGIITDFGGFWSTTTVAQNSSNPTTSHNLLAFTYNGTTYSTGANDATLTSNSVAYTSGNFKAIPVAGIAGTNSSGGSTYIALAKNVDGNSTTGDPSAVSSYTIKKVLTDGTGGLDLGTGVTNLPVSAVLKYNIGNIVTSKIADAEPDIIITQIADPSTGNDVFQFVDASGTLVGNTVTQDMTLLNPLGTYVLDLFTLTPSTPYNTASVYANYQSNVTRQIRLVAFKLSDFGITSGNASSVRGLLITPSGNSDYAFIAYNANALNLPPSISQNSGETNTSVCAAGIANLSVVANPAKGGTLSYTWERSTNGGTTWTTVSNGGNVSGATTNKLVIASPANNDQYRATVAESGSSLTNTSDPFTITIVSPAAPTAVTVSGTASTCINNAVIISSSVTGGSNLYYQWQTNASGSYIDITGANLSNYEPPVDAAGIISYKVKASSGNGCASLTSSNAATITVSANTVAGTTSGSSTVCSGTNSTTLTLSGNTGSVIKWQSSTDNFATVITDIVNTTTSLTSTNLTATTQYRAVVQSGACASANSTTSTVTVTASVGGTISGSATVCTGTNSTALTLSGYTGSIIKWQSSTDNFATVITDLANTMTSLTATNLTATMQYRAVIQYGSCAVSNSAIATVTVNASVGGSISGSATVCTGTNSTTLTLSGNTGSVVKWQSSTDNFSSVINDIANTTTTLIATSLTATTQYRAVVQSGICATANSSIATVTVNPASVGGSISGSATVCTGTNSTTLTLSGNTGSVVKWQSSTDNFSSVINDIANTTTTLNATNLTATTQYRAVVQSGVCSIANSSTATVAVSPASVGGSVSGSAIVCTGTNSTSLTLSGNTGSAIKWQSSTDNFGSVINDIANTTTTLTATNLTTTTQYRAIVQSGPCASTNSSVATVTVNAASVGGSVSGSATVCTGTNSTTLTLSGNTGSIVKWQLSTNNFSSSTDIANTTTTLTATNLTATTQYRAVIQSGVCTVANSSVATVTVSPASFGGIVNGNATVCSGTNSTTLNLIGNNGSIIEWQSSTDNFATVTNHIANTTSSLTADDLTATIQYRVAIQSGPCAINYSSTATITVNPLSDGGNVSGAAKECEGTNSRTLTLINNVGNVIKWQSSTDNFVADINNIANTTNSLIVDNLSITTRYRAIVQSGACAPAYSASAQIRIISTGGWIGSVSGDYDDPANWCGGIPPPTADVVIPANTTVYINSADVTIHSITISTNASIVMQNGYNLNIATGGSFTNNGSFDATASTGKVTFQGDGTITGTTTFQNIETYGALDFGTASTIAGDFTIQNGGSVSVNSPFYTCPSSNLIYNTGGVYNRNLEWLPVASGKGYPSNVTVQNNTTINFPVEGDGYICNDLNINAGSALYQDYSTASAALFVGRNVTINGTLSLGEEDGDDISLGGNWKRNAGGVFNNNQRTVIFNGAGNSLITAPVSAGRDANGAFGGETFYKVMVTKTVNSATVSLGSPMSVIYELALTKGTFDLQNSDVTMVSNISGSAHLAPLPTSGGVVTNVALHYGGVSETGSGRFVIQHYFNLSEDPASRRWHFLTVPFDPSDAPTISTAWQEGVSNSSRAIPVDPWPGFGTTITKTKAYDPASGYDQGLTNNPSLYYYTGTDWGILPTTNTQPITDYQAYMLFIRGSRNIVISSPRVDANPTTLEPRGKLSLGDVGKPLAAGFQPMGNPYAADIDFNKAAFNNYTAGGMTYNTTPGSPEGLGITYYIWDPLTDGSAGVGKFIACSSNGDGTYTVTSNTGGIPEDGTIPAGAAFMLAADNGGASLTFHEADKLNTSFGAVSRPAAPSQLNSTFSSNLYAGSGAAADLADGVVNIYADYSNNVDGQDALSLSTFNTHEWLSIARDGTSLSIERRNWIKANDTIFLALKNLKKTAYELHFKASNFDPSITAMLEDTYTGKSTSLNVTDGTNVSFTINSDSASSAVDRFRVVFRPSATLPITFRTVKAYQQNNSIAIQWTVENQLNITKYQVEKSTNGTSFSTIVTVSANGDQQSVITYNSLDANAAEGNNFYRIKYFNGNGTFAYSRIVKVVFGNGNSNISVYPNPVTDGNITLQLNNIPAGVYNIRIIDNLGKIVSKTVLTHSGGNATQTFYQKNLISGTYMLEMSDADNKTKSVKLIVESK